ncbi:Diphthamide biosynthesis protein 2, partial [Spiromyces aspiralis]
MSAEISHPVPVAASGLEAVERQVDAPSAKLTSSLVEFEEFYEIDQTARIISEGGYRRVALQFPDEMLADSTCVAERLADLTGSKMFVLADTTYGSCCIDEVAAQHCDSDLIVHYGHTCLTLTSRIPVLFVYGRLGFDTDKFIQAFASQFASDVDKERRFALLYHVSYAYKICEVTERLKARGYHNVTKSNVRRSFEPYIPKDGAATSTTDRGCCSGCPVSASCEGPAAAEAPVPLSHQDYISRDASAAGSGEEFGIAGRTFDGLDAGSLAEHTIIYLGKEGPTLSNIMLTNSKSQVYSYNPDTDQLRCESAVVNRHLGRRYMM